MCLVSQLLASLPVEAWRQGLWSPLPPPDFNRKEAQGPWGSIGEDGAAAHVESAQEAAGQSSLLCHPHRWRLH